MRCLELFWYGHRKKWNTETTKKLNGQSKIFRRWTLFTKEWIWLTLLANFVIKQQLLKLINSKCWYQEKTVPARRWFPLLFCFKPFTPISATDISIVFTLSNARRFYLSRGNFWEVKGLKKNWLKDSLKLNKFVIGKCFGVPILWLW